MMLRRYHQGKKPDRPADPRPDTTTTDAPQADKPAGRSRPRRGGDA